MLSTIKTDEEDKNKNVYVIGDGALWGMFTVEKKLMGGKVLNAQKTEN